VIREVQATHLTIAVLVAADHLYTTIALSADQLPLAAHMPVAAR